MHAAAPATVASSDLTMKPERLYALDLLRFIAAMAVVAVHWCFVDTHMQPFMKIEAAKYGLFGVHLFFMISGFVILMSAQGQDVRSFIVARIIRLYPAFWICCTISALFVLITGDPLLGWAEYLGNMMMFADPRAAPYINDAYWSLVVEAKFYLLITVLLLFGALHRIELVMWGWLMIAAVPSSVLMRDLLVAHYAPYFAAGCACYLVGQHATWARWALLLAAWIVAMKETAREVLQQQHVADTFTSCLLVTVFFMILLAVSKRWLVLPAWRGIATLGAISYPIYLLHQRIAIEMGWTTDNAALLLVAFAWIIVLSWVVHVWGEIPLQRWLKGKFKQGQGLDSTQMVAPAPQPTAPSSSSP